MTSASVGEALADASVQRELPRVCVWPLENRSPAVADIVVRAGVDAGDDLLGVVALQADAGRAEVRVAELALADVGA